MDHATSATPLVSGVLAPCHKNLRIVHSIRRRTPSGIRARAMKYVGIADKTDWSSTTCLPRDRSRACQPPNRASIFAVTGCQSASRIRPSVSGNPRYRMGREATGVDKIADTCASASGVKPIPTTADLAQFKRRPEKSENISIMEET